MSNQPAGQRQEFAATVAALREQRRWSQTELGKQLAEKARSELDRRDVLATTRQTVSLWERGMRFPDALNAYLLCLVFEKDPEELCLHRVVTPAVAARFDQRRTQVVQARGATVEAQSKLDDTQGVRWESLGFIFGAMRRVDAMTVDDQWALTQRYLDDRRRMRGRPLLELMIAHVVRLRQ